MHSKINPVGDWVDRLFRRPDLKAQLKEGCKIKQRSAFKHFKKHNGWMRGAPETLAEFMKHVKRQKRVVAKDKVLVVKFIE